MAKNLTHGQQHMEASPDLARLLARTPAVIEPGHTFDSVTETISHTVLSKKTPLGWFLGFGIAFALLMILNMTIGNLLMTGIGIWGNNIPVGWAFTAGVRQFTNWEARFAVDGALVALGVSCAVGILSGLFPAWRASRLDPITALRTS